MKVTWSNEEVDGPRKQRLERSLELLNRMTYYRLIEDDIHIDKNHEAIIVKTVDNEIYMVHADGGGPYLKIDKWNDEY